MTDDNDSVRLHGEESNRVENSDCTDQHGCREDQKDRDTLFVIDLSSSQEIDRQDDEHEIGEDVR